MIYIANCPALIWLFEIIDRNIMNNTFPHIIFVVKQDLPSFTWIHKKIRFSPNSSHFMKQIVLITFEKTVQAIKRSYVYYDLLQGMTLLVLRNI